MKLLPSVKHPVHFLNLSCRNINFLKVGVQNDLSQKFPQFLRVFNNNILHYLVKLNQLHPEYYDPLIFQVIGHVYDLPVYIFLQLPQLPNILELLILFLCVLWDIFAIFVLAWYFCVLFVFTFIILLPFE